MIRINEFCSVVKLIIHVIERKAFILIDSDKAGVKCFFLFLFHEALNADKEYCEQQYGQSPGQVWRDPEKKSEGANGSCESCQSQKGQLPDNFFCPG